MEVPRGTEPDVADAQKSNLNSKRKFIKDRIEYGMSYLSAVIRKARAGYGRNTHFSEERDVLISESIFLADRTQIIEENGKTKVLVDAQGSKIACELIASTDFDLKSIIKESEVGVLEDMYARVSSLQTIHFNQLISLDHQAGLPFERQTGLARLQLIKFFIIKKKRCILDRIDYNYSELDKHLVADDKLRLDYIQSEMRHLVREAFALCADDPELLDAFKTSAAAIVTDAPTNPELPTKAPKLYKERENRKQTPAEFIEEVYQDWLGKGLMRPHIKELDLPLYQSLYRRGVPERFDTLLPKAAGRSVGDLSKSALELVTSKRASARRTWEKRQKSSKLPSSP